MTRVVRSLRSQRHSSLHSVLPPPESPERSPHKLGPLVRNAAIAFLGAVVSGLLGYVFRLVVARIEVDQYGLYNLGLTALNLLFVIGSAGLLTGVTRFTAAYVGR